MSPSGNNDHARVVELLPWFVTGTLPEEERALVERHVTECLPCRKTLNEERRLHMAVNDAATSPHSPEHGLDALLRTIDSAHAHAPAGRSRTWPALAAAAGVTIVAVGLWISLAGETPRTDDAYATLSAPGSRSIRIDVVFRNGVGAQEIDGLARRFAGRVVAGPSEIGRYTIELDADSTGSRDLERVLEAMRGDPSVRLAARSFLEEVDE